jgi:putative protease
MFHMAHCVTAACLSDGEDCRSCGGPCRGHTVHLRDRKGVDHLMLRDAAGRSTVYTGRVQSAAELRPALRAMKIGYWRVDMLDESPEHARQLVEIYAGWMAGEVSPEDLLHHLKRQNAAGVTAGTFDFQ